MAVNEVQNRNILPRMTSSICKNYRLSIITLRSICPKALIWEKFGSKCVIYCQEPDIAEEFSIDIKLLTQM